ncbi:MAG: Rrf2 family transcriptional regulator [Devosiaceae bacterium]|nr:Rrf2 family transcriptional regulator [Devosiaceae bacterium MH13]
MKRSSKLSIALHVLGHMAVKPDEPFTSEQMASFAATNPVVIRRTLGQLREAGLVTSGRGKSGGWKLARAPESISIADVYRGLDERLYVGNKGGDENPAHCAIEIGLAGAIQGGLERAEVAFQSAIEGTSLADLAAALQR